MQRNINSLSSQTFELLVIGSGVHGACVARDAALRGVKVAMIDKADICGATSHNSLKTIHGGLRYLQHLNFKRTLESIKEQKYWLATAPHLIKPLQFLMPTYGFGVRGPIAMYLGLRLFDLMCFGRNRQLGQRSKLARGKILSRQACLSLAPDIPKKNLSGAAVWSEAQVELADQAVMQLTQHAASLGAVVANYVTAEEFLLDHDTVVGVHAIDEIAQAPIVIKAKTVVNATGPWAADLLQNSAENPLSQMQLPLSKSMNVVTRLPAKSLAVGVQSSLASDSKLGNTKRLYFMVPWLDLTVIGTTHFPYQGGADALTLKPQEISAFVADINDAYPCLNLSPKDVIYCYQGLGPADSSAGKASQMQHSKVIDHAKQNNIQGLVTIVSIKWTTARLVAERAVDLVCNKLERTTSPVKRACQTRHTNIPNHPQLHPKFYQLDDEALRSLCLLHIRETMTLRLSDMLLRRTNDLVTNRLSINQIKLIANTMSKHFSWSAEHQQRELATLRQQWLADDLRDQLNSSSFWNNAACS